MTSLHNIRRNECATSGEISLGKSIAAIVSFGARQRDIPKAVGVLSERCKSVLGTVFFTIHARPSARCFQCPQPGGREGYGCKDARLRHELHPPRSRFDTRTTTSCRPVPYKCKGLVRRAWRL